MMETKEIIESADELVEKNEIIKEQQSNDLQKKKKLNKFILGIILGICFSTVVFGFVFLCTKSTDKGIISDYTEKKLKLLKGVVDSKFLYNTDKTNMEEGLLKGYISGLGDMYTQYYTKDETAEFLADTNGVFYGIGATFEQAQKGGEIKAVSILDNTPAKEAGVMSGDILVKVDGKDITGQDLDKVVAKVRGEADTKVKITVIRDGKTHDFEIKRAKINVPTVAHKIIDGNIGYIVVSQFAQDTENQFKAALDDVKAKNVKGVVIDLRDNPGGIVDTCVSMLDEILPKGMVVYMQDKNKKREEYFAKDDKKIEVPFVVLTNENSASASEIFAGAIKDTKAGTIIGSKTYGKGVVQELLKLTDGSCIKITTYEYFTPKGNSINKKGITPDIEVTDSDANDNNDVVLNKALQVIKGK